MGPTITPGDLSAAASSCPADGTDTPNRPGPSARWGLGAAGRMPGLRPESRVPGMRLAPGLRIGCP